MLTIKLDLPRLHAAIRNKLQFTKKTEAQVINKVALNIAYRAGSFVPKVTAGQVTANLRAGNLLPKLASLACNRKYGKGGWTKQQHLEAMEGILKKRRRGVNAIRAGWAPAIQALGGTFRGAKLLPGSTASEGYGIRALPEYLQATLVNTVVTDVHRVNPMGAGEIPAAVRALERAVEFVTDDMEGYIADKIAEAFNSVER